MLAPSPDTAVDRLAGVVDELGHNPIDHLAPQALGDDIVQIRRQIDRLEAQFVRRLERFDRLQGAAAEHTHSTVAWLRATCGLTAAAAVERVRLARVLDELPRTQESFSAGRAPFSNVSMIARLAEAVGTQATRNVERTLVTAAEELDTGRMRDLVQFTRYRIDADGALDADNRNHERRWLQCSQTFDGMFVINGELDAEGGARVATALDALSRPCGPDDERTGGQRRADALVDLATRQLQNGGLPDVHGQRPHLVVTVSADTLTGAPGAAPAELRGAGPVHPATAQRLACDAALTTAVVGDDGAIHAVGAESRTVPAPLRTALALRDKGCVVPRCGCPPGWTDAHHIQHRANGGRTVLENLVLLCRRHHRLVHEEGWKLSLLPDGSVTITDPRTGAPVVRRL